MTKAPCKKSHVNAWEFRGSGGLGRGMEKGERLRKTEKYAKRPDVSSANHEGHCFVHEKPDWQVPNSAELRVYRLADGSPWEMVYDAIESYGK